MPQVRWLKQALSDLDRLLAFLKPLNEAAAHRALRKIQAAGSSLGKTPYQGVALRDQTGRRKLMVPFGKSGYVIYYILEHDTVVIIGVFHGREDRPH